MDYTFAPADERIFAVYHTIYEETNISQSFHWAERVEDLIPNPHGLFLLCDGEPVGGVKIEENRVSCPFLIPPFDDRQLFWELVVKQVKGRELSLSGIPEPDAQILLSMGAKALYANRRMCRPTAAIAPPALGQPEGIQFAQPALADLEEVIQVVYAAHTAGFTATVYGTPDIAVFNKALAYRFEAFTRTNTLSFGVIARDSVSRRIAGVCIAGIYPDSMDDFSTINQVSVLPEYRRRGIAKAMILRAIDQARPVSQVITLGVLAGNPAEQLYRSLGFLSGSAYHTLTYTLE